MEKIKCPHCGAINQDVTEQDLCWQCDKPLSASKSAVQEPIVANTAQKPTSNAYGGQIQQPQPSLEERVEARKQERLANRRSNPAMRIVVTLLLLILIMVLYFLFFRK